MAQFDVYINENEDTNKQMPFLLDVQNDILKDLSTRIVVPLVINAHAIGHVNPKFEIGDVHVVMSTSQMAGISTQFLRTKVINISEKRTEILSAIDFVFTGF